MNSQDLFYQESGKINPLRQSLSYGICVVGAMILGYLYSVFIIFVPFVYLNILFIYGFGMILGAICRVLVRFSHNRNKRSQIIQAVIIGLLANYFQWTVYILHAITGEIPNIELFMANLHWIVIPNEILTAIVEINRVGTWSILGLDFNGFGLTLIWIIEFIVIIGWPVVSIVKANTYPYSELLHKWYHKYTLFRDFETIVVIDDLINDLELDPIKAIDFLKKGSAMRHSKVHLYYLKDENVQYLTFENVLNNSQGKGDSKSSIVINNFKISNSDAEMILEKHESKRESMPVI